LVQKLEGAVSGLGIFASCLGDPSELFHRLADVAVRSDLFELLV
jgi:hypothetical protein